MGEKETTEYAAVDKEVGRINEKIKEIHDDLEANVVGIKVPRELIFGIDLCYHSVGAFIFQGRLVEKGMIEVLIVGDTRTGKSETIKRLMQHYRRGDFIQGEACSLAGLLGGVDEGSNNNRFVKCGRLPLSHKQLVCIDEANELHEDIVGKMSGVRSSGYFDIIKIVTGRILCRIRLIWIANPRSGKRIGEYSFGVETIPEVIGKPEDIARFDFALIVGRKSIDIDSLYVSSDKKKKVPHVYTSGLCRDLIMWAWSRRPDQVEISTETEKEILDWSKGFSKHFSEMIPLVVETEIRVKIARLSIAIAARLYSCDETGEKVIVSRAHVIAACEWLFSVYESEGIGYRQFSEQMKTGNLGSEVDEVCTALGKKGMLALLNMRVITKGLLRDIFQDSSSGDIAFSKLLLGRGIRNRGRGFRMTESFIDKLKSLRSDPAILTEPDGKRLPGSTPSDGFDF
jgi:hypothetical protein